MSIKPSYLTSHSESDEATLVIPQKTENRAPDLLVIPQISHLRGSAIRNRGQETGDNHLTAYRRAWGIKSIASQ